MLKRAIAWGPVAFSVRLGLKGVALLLIVARIIGVHSYPQNGDNRGIWFEPNWSVMYTIVFPAVFGGLIYMITLLRKALGRLTQIAVIRKAVNGSDDHVPAFEAYVAAEMAKSARPLTWVCAGLAVTLSVIHGAGLIFFLLSRGRPPVDDWTTMYRLGSVPFWGNLLFDIVAYSFECFIIFLGFFFVLKFWLFLHIFSLALRRSGVPYEFDPLVHDPDQTLGLRPLGEGINLYLLLVVVFETYVLGRRLQLITKAGEYTLSEYLTKLVDGSWSFQRVIDPRLYQWNTIDAGLWALLIFLTLPLIVGAYLPLWTLRRYLKQRRDDLWLESARAHDDARRRGDEQEASALEKRMLQLGKAQLWPNGDASGWRLLGLAVAIALAAWAPPLCAALVATGLGVEIASSVVRSLKSRRAG